MFRKLLRTLFVLQEVDNTQRTKQGLEKLGRGFSKAYRFNPYNPLSYVSLLIIIVSGLLMFGLIGFWKEIETDNPFKSN